MDNNTEQSTAFDNIISNRELQIIKSALPYIPVGEQKFISIFVKFQELKNTMNLYDQSSDGSVGICSTSNDTISNLSDMVNSIKVFCTDSEKEELDLLYNMASGFTLAGSKTANSEAQKANNQNILKLMRSMLSPEQQTMLDSYSLLFNNIM